MMRILFVIAGLGRGGAETQVIRLTEKLMQDHKVKIISLLEDNAFQQRIDSQNMDVVTLPINGRSRLFRNLGRVLQEMRQFQPDCLIGFMFHGIMVARLGTLLTGKPSIGSVRTEKAQGFKDRLLQWTDFLSRGMVVNAENTRNKLIERKITSGSKIQVINNAMDDVFFEESLQSAAPASRFRWVTIGRLIEAKGHDLLIRAMTELPEAELTVVGGGPLKAQLEELVGTLNLQDRVHLVGDSSDIRPHLRAADAFVLSSRWEGMPNALLEAMAAGKACVTTNVGGVQALQGNHLLVVPANDEAHLAKGMRNMMQFSAEERALMGQQARQLVREHFSASAVVKMWEEFIQNSSNHRRI